MTAEQEKELADLLVKAQEGDRVAYRDFLDRTARHVRPFVARRLSPLETVEEVVQEVLLSLHGARHTYEPGKPVVPWIMAITRRRVFDYLRKWMKGARNETGTDNFQDNVLAWSTEADATSALMMREAIAGLSERQREIIELIKVDGLSTREVSQKLEMSETGVRVTAHRAYEKIKKYFTVNEYENG